MVRTCFVLDSNEKRVELVAAAVAQLAEHFFGKEEVDGSNPFCGSSIISLLLKPLISYLRWRLGVFLFHESLGITFTWRTCVVEVGKWVN